MASISFEINLLLRDWTWKPQYVDVSATKLRSRGWDWLCFYVGIVTEKGPSK